MRALSVLTRPQIQGRWADDLIGSELASTSAISDEGFALTIPGLIERQAALIPDVVATVADESPLTYAELDRRSAAHGAGLLAVGLRPGERVGLLAPNVADWAVAAYAVLRVGAVLVPFSTLLRPPELLAQLAVASVDELIVVDEFRGRRFHDELEDAAPGIGARVAAGERHPAAPSLRRIWTLDELPTGDDVEQVHAAGTGVEPDDDMVILFTSGSTGSPKGVIHTHGGGIRAIAAGLDDRCVRFGERVYIPMPFFWTGGFSSGLISTLIAGATLLTESEPEPGATLAFLARHSVTVFRGWPDQAVRLAAHPDFATVDLSAMGDGTLPALLPPERRPVPGARANLFGMTETFGPYCGAPLDRDLPAGKFGSCGRPFEGVEVRISDPDTGAAVATGGDGEIWLRGPHLLRGIVGRDRADVFTPDGYFRTGDRGRLDDDGYLWFTGRLDDMFKVSGATVYPSEVEAALRSIGDVRHAYVTKVVGDDGRVEVGAWVVSDRAADELRPLVKGRLSSFKVPTRWHVTADPTEVPMTATGKVDKVALGRLLEQA